MPRPRSNRSRLPLLAVGFTLLRGLGIGASVANPDRPKAGSTFAILGSRKILENTALTCPVHRSLGDDVDIPVEFRYC